MYSLSILNLSFMERITVQISQPVPGINETKFSLKV